MGSLPSIDFTFWETEWEGDRLQEYLQTLSESLAWLERKQEQNIEEVFGNDRDLASTRTTMELLIADGIATRYLTGSAVVAIWAYLESCIYTVAKFVARKLAIERNIDQTPGRIFLDKATLFFEGIPGMTLLSNDEQREFLDDLLDVRNAFAHAGGVLGSLSSKRYNRLPSVVARHQDLSIENGLGEMYLVVRWEFSVAAYARVAEIRDGLHSRAKALPGDA